MTIPIPIYPAARPLELADRELLQEHFRVLQPTVSELTFANLYLFRHLHRYRLTSINASLILSGCGYDGAPYFLPPLSADRGDTARRLLAEGHTLYAADEQFVSLHLADRGYALSADRDNDDYLYLRSDLAELPGKRFNKKKNRINYFASRHHYSVEPFSPKHLHASLQLLDGWHRTHKDGASRSLLAEIAATREGLELADELALMGVVLLTERGVSAFALGEMLNDATAVCHFEKADPFLEGAAQLVNREFSRFQLPACTYINREQDLGESGLRGAKNSYHPIRMIRKFRIKLADVGD